jgi:hypothetical protein
VKSEGRRKRFRLGRMLRLVFLFAGLLALAPPATARAPVRPVLVELYTAQGCVPCAPANKVANQISRQSGVVVLTFPVDYWDYLGWEDSFAQDEFTARQKAYGRRFGSHAVSTPRMIIDGAAQTTGDHVDAVQALIAKSRRHPSGHASISYRRNRLSVSAPRAADVWLVRYDPGVRSVEVKAGDNKGANVAYRNTVRQLVRLKHPRGAILPRAPERGLATLIIVQGAQGGPVFAVRKL